MFLPLPIVFAIQHAVNALLTIDSGTKAALSKLNAKVVQFRVSSPEVVLTLSITDGRIDVLSGYDGSVDTTISGSLSALLSLLNSNDAMYTGAVHIDGDVAVGQKIKHVLGGIDIDWQEWLLPLIGDARTKQISDAGERLTQWWQETGTSLKHESSLYLQDRDELLVPAIRIAHYCDDVDSLVATMDRLEARVKHMESARQSGIVPQ